MVMSTFGVIQNPITVTTSNLKEITTNVSSNLEELAKSSEPMRTISSVIPSEVKSPGQIQILSDVTVRSLIAENCNFETILRKVRSQQVKFNFDDCDSQQTNFKLKNKTNGYQAQIFSLRGKSSLSTDYVQLRMGENELMFESRSSTGQVSTRLIKIIREH